MYHELQPQNNTRLQASPMRKPGSESTCSSLPRLLSHTSHLRLVRCMLGFGTLTTKNGRTHKHRQRHTVQGARSSLCTSLVRAALSAGNPLYLPIPTSWLTIKSAAKGLDVHYRFLATCAADVSFTTQLCTQCRSTQDPLLSAVIPSCAYAAREDCAAHSLKSCFSEHFTCPVVCKMPVTEKPLVSSTF